MALTQLSCARSRELHIIQHVKKTKVRRQKIQKFGDIALSERLCFMAILADVQRRVGSHSANCEHGIVTEPQLNGASSFVVTAQYSCSRAILQTCVSWSASLPQSRWCAASRTSTLENCLELSTWHASSTR